MLSCAIVFVSSQCSGHSMRMGKRNEILVTGTQLAAFAVNQIAQYAVFLIRCPILLEMTVVRRRCGASSPDVGARLGLEVKDGASFVASGRRMIDSTRQRQITSDRNTVGVVATHADDKRADVRVCSLD